MNPTFKLKIPESEKTLDWFKSILNTIVPYDTTVISDYERMRLSYAIINNDLTMIKDKLDQFYKPLGEAFDFLGQLDDMVIPYNKVYSKFMYHVGQMLKYGDEMEVILNSDTSYAVKSEELQKLYAATIEEYTMLQHELADMEMQGSSPQELQDYYNSMRTLPEPQDIDPKQYSSSLEQFYSKLVRFFKFKYNLRALKAASFKHGLISDRSIVTVVNNQNIPAPVVLNPLHFGFHKSPDEPKIEKGDYWWYKTAITIGQAYDELQDRVDAEELEKLEAYTGASSLRPTDKWDIKKGAEAVRNYSNYEMYKDSSVYADKHVGQAMGSGSNRRYNSARLIWKCYMEFKAYKEVGILTYVDEEGREVSEFVDASYPVPNDFSRVKILDRYGRDTFVKQWIDAFGNSTTLETLWIPRRYEVTRYGTDTFVDFREVPNQPLSIDNPFDFELTAKGRIYSGFNAEPISLVERAIPCHLQLIWIKNLQNKELAKYEGFIKSIDVSQIPDYLTKDENGEPLYSGVDKIAIWRYYRKKLGDSYFDSTQDSNGLPNYQKTAPVNVEMAGQIAEIINLENLAELIDREMGMQMLVPPQAEGVFQTYSNATDNQQALQQGLIMAEELYAEHNDVWRAVINEFLIQTKNQYKRFFEENPDVTETYLHYILPDGSKEALKITSEFLDHEDMGVFIQGGNYGNEYRNYMMARLQDFAQNRGEGMSTISELVKAVARREDPETIHKMIVRADKEQQRRAAEMEKVRQEAQIKALQEQSAMQDKLQQYKLDQIGLQNQGRVDVVYASAAVNGENDKDGIPAEVEIAEKERKLAQKDREIAIKERQPTK